MKMKTLLISFISLSAIALTGCAELQNELRSIGSSAKDSAVMRAKMEASSKASEATGKVLGSKY